MTVRNRLISALCLAATLFAAGCATKPPVPSIDAGTRFEDLKGILMAKVKTTRSRSVPGGGSASSRGPIEPGLGGLRCGRLSEVVRGPVRGLQRP